MSSTCQKSVNFPGMTSAWSEFTKLKALSKRNWIIYIRYKMYAITYLRQTLFGIQIFTLFMGCFLAINGVGNDPVGLKLGVVNYDGQCHNGEKAPMHDKLGYQFLQTLGYDGVTMNLVRKDTEEEALSALKMGHVLGYIVIPRNYSQHLRNRILFNLHAGNETLDGSTISVRLDNSNYIVSYFARQYISSSMFQFMEKLAKTFDIDTRKANPPIKFHSIHGSLTDTWNIFLAPVYLLIIWASNCTVCALFHGQDKTQTSLSRTLATGVDYRTVIFSHYATDALIMLPQAFVMCTYFWWDRGDRIEGNWAVILLILYIVRVNITSLSLLVAEISKNLVNAIFVVLAVVWISIYASDTLWPIETVPWWYRPFCYALPLTNPNRLLRSIMTRGWGITHPSVFYYGVIVPFIISFIAFTATGRIGRKG